MSLWNKVRRQTTATQISSARRAAPNQNYVTIGPIARLVGCQEHHVRRLSNANEIPYLRVGRLRIFAVGDADRIRQACRARGWTSEQDARFPRHGRRAARAKSSTAIS